MDVGGEVMTGDPAGVAGDPSGVTGDPAGVAIYSTEPAVRATILVSMHDRTRHHSLVVELVRRAHRFKMAGATVFEGKSGFGESKRVHRPHLLSEDTPASVILIDRPERIDAFLTEISDLLEDVLVVLDEVEILTALVVDNEPPCPSP
jgi:uncharacterized protein